MFACYVVYVSTQKAPQNMKAYIFETTYERFLPAFPALGVPKRCALPVVTHVGQGINKLLHRHSEDLALIRLVAKLV